MKLAVTLLLPAILTGCVAWEPTKSADDESGTADDPVLDTNKADGGDVPYAKGTEAWSTRTLGFDNGAGAAADMIYVSFELSGPADITLETESAGDDALDTILYIYEPTPTKWGAYLAKNDDSGAGKLSKLARHLDAGAYRVLIKRRNGAMTIPKVALTGTCTGAGCVAPEHGCDPHEARSQAPDLFVGPDGWQQGIEAAIDSAQVSLDVQMYLFTVTDIAQHIIDAQQKRGVAVRVLLDPHEDNSVVTALLVGGGIANHTDPAVFSFAHAKYMIIDGSRAVIQSGNFNVGAVKTTGGGERNYAIVDYDADDVADLQAIYESDWVAGPEPDLSCTRLIVSPINSATRVVDHVNSAMHTLDIEVLYLDEPNVRAAIVDAATNRSVAVRILLSDPAKNPQNTATQTYFSGLGIPTKFLISNYLHTKMIKADGVALVGSENMSTTSLTKNREVGALVFETDPVAKIAAQYELDWAAGQ